MISNQPQSSVKGKGFTMSEENTPNQELAPVDNKELNFRKMEQMYERQLSKEREAREAAERALEDKSKKHDDDDDDDEPYIDKKRLKKEQAKFGQQMKQETQTEIQRAVHTALQEERKQQWLKTNSDFFDVMKHAERFAQKDPELAESILTMPEGFERQKLVYKNIKALGLHEPEKKQPTIQDKIDSNKRSPYYQPSGVGTSPYASGGDYSPVGQKNAYDKMKELQSRLRI